MKKSELYQIIKEEIFSLLKEENVRHYKITYDDNGKEIKKEVLYLDKTYSIKGKNYSKEIPELNLSKNQEIKPANVSEAKKDKSGLPFALAANIVKYGQPQTPKGAKKTDLTKKQEKQVKKTAEKFKKSIKENNTPKHKIVAQWMGPDFFLAKKKEETWDDKDYDLFYRLEKMVTTTGEVPKLNENKDNYMFFQNLKTIKEAVDEMLAMDPEMVDMILSNGHDWANDHIATSKDDTEEVYNFLKSKSAALVAEKLKGGQKKLDANKNGKIDAEDFKLLKAKKK